MTVLRVVESCFLLVLLAFNWYLFIMNVEWKKYDVLVIGSGGAGSHAAHAASNKGASVLVVSKDPLGVSDTKISEGLATVRESGSNDDSVETLSENIKIFGKSLT